MKVTLYFGSFNPIHLGHLIIANHCLNYCENDQIWFVVSPHNPLKESKSLLNENQRFHLLQLAIEDEPRFRASKIEFSLPRPSYTVDTMTYLAEKYPEHEFQILLGGDSFQNIKKWKNYQILLENYDLLIYQRPGHKIDETLSKRIKVLEAPLLEISATRIRKLVKEGKSARFLLPEEVYQEILASSYYKA